jgi:hypothetical protein
MSETPGFRQRPNLREVNFVVRPGKPPHRNIVCVGSILLPVEGADPHTHSTVGDFSREMTPWPQANADEARDATTMSSHLNGIKVERILWWC